MYQIELCPWLADLVDLPTKFTGTIEKESAKAYKVSFKNKSCWLAKSKIIHIQEVGEEG